MFALLASLCNQADAPRIRPRATTNYLTDTAANNLGDYDGGPFEIIHNHGKIVQVLRQAAENKQPVMLNSLHLGDSAPGLLLDVLPSCGEVLIQPPPNAQAQRALLNDRRFNLLIRRPESSILMSMTLSRLDNWNRQDCYVAQLPTWAVSSEMRAWRRTRLPAAAGLSLYHRLHSKEAIQARVVDISEGGIALTAPRPTEERIHIHDHWRLARLVLGEKEIGQFPLEVRNIKDINGDMRIGLAIRQAHEDQLQRLRRLLLRLQSKLC